ncbi:hypothetical protein [Pseudophaeobacter sp.]|uniref:hypothetical protein n=1 Tax=Pseudophaeobacter sp. TaxID=1971739 RepID=UPI0032985E97
MSDAIVRIAEEGQNSDLLPIGTALYFLSQNQGTIAGGGPPVFSSDIPDNHTTWPGPMQQKVGEIYNSLAVTVFDGAGGHTIIPSGDPTQIKAHLKLKFVFEKEGEMVVPIPHLNALERGKSNAPLNFRVDYNSYIRASVFDEVEEDFAAALRESSLTAAQFTEVMKIYDEIENSGNLEGEVPGEDEETFHTQLGEYSVRQCQ